MRPNLKLAREARSVFMGLADCRWEMGFNQGVLYVLSELEKDTDDTAVGAEHGRCIDLFKAAMLRDLEKYNAGAQQMQEASRVYRKCYDRINELIIAIKRVSTSLEEQGITAEAEVLKQALDKFSKPVRKENRDGQR